MKCAVTAAISGVETSIHRSSINLFWRLNCCQSAIFRLQWARRQTLTFSPYVGEYIFSYIRWNYPKWENFSCSLDNAQPVGKSSKWKSALFLPFSYGLAWEIDGKMEGLWKKTWENLHVRWSLCRNFVQVIIYAGQLLHQLIRSCDSSPSACRLNQSAADRYRGIHKSNFYLSVISAVSATQQLANHPKTFWCCQRHFSQISSFSKQAKRRRCPPKGRVRFDINTRQNRSAPQSSAWQRVAPRVSLPFWQSPDSSFFLFWTKLSSLFHRAIATESKCTEYPGISW